MAKTDSFFIRAKVTSSGGSYRQTPIDLGFVVDAVGKSVLRILNIQTQIFNAGSVFPWTPSGEESLSWNLTTQDQPAMVDVTNKSVIAMGSFLTSDDAVGAVQLQSETADINPSKFSNGYLVATETIYLNLRTNNLVGTEADVNILIECQGETMTTAKAMALSLSQQ